MRIKKFLIALLLPMSILTTKCKNEHKKKFKDLPDAEVYDMNGRHTTLRQLAGDKVLFIDCWYIPCPPCFMAMGVLHKVYARVANNKNICFITICATDSAQIKAFIRQDNTMKAYVNQYQYLSHLNEFKLPVYFLPGCSSKVSTGAKMRSYAVADRSKCADAIFDFHGYPTSMIFDRHGTEVFKETGFDGNDKYEQRLTKALDGALANFN